MSKNKHPEETISKILKVSIQLFNEKGYEKTTIADIVSALGMSKGAIYHHFKSKEAIVEAICETCYRDAQSHMLDRLKSDPNKTGLQILQSAFLEQVNNEQKQIVDRISMDYAKNPKVFMHFIKHNITDDPVFIIDIIERGIKDGSIQDQDAKSAAQILLLLLNFWVSSPLLEDTKENIIDKLHYLRFLTNSIGIPIVNDEILDAATQYFTNMH